MIITFPPNPIVGQEFVASNGATYVWTSGGYWSSIVEIEQGTAAYIVEGGESTTEENTIILDGGTS